MTLSRQMIGAVAIFAVLASIIMFANSAHAQTASLDQLRATIKTEIMADPRSQTMSSAQINALVNALTTQAQKQGLTTAQLTYRPEVQSAPSTGVTQCSDLSCSLAQAFGLDGSLPIIPVALIVLAVLFIATYSVMREMGHPHAQA
ncbi:MAG: hypothetical protein P4L81_01760 [Candidatus Pacebacteria bacterium]|nr:hypothetical protein [Candidatus Paceibacterota bacterium]